MTVVALFVISLLTRQASPGGHAAAGAGSMVWGWLGVGIALVSSWFGGELVEALGISVNEGANPNAPSSLNVEFRRHGGRASRSEIRPH